MLLAITHVQWLKAGDLFLWLSLLYDCFAGAVSKQYIPPFAFFFWYVTGCISMCWLLSFGSDLSPLGGIGQGEKKQNGEGVGRPIR